MKYTKEFWDKQPFGKMSDYQLAKKLCVRRKTVYRQRVKRNIEAFRKRTTHTKEFWDKQPLGEIADRQLAKKLRVDPRAVYQQRVKRNINAHTVNCVICNSKLSSDRSITYIHMCKKCNVRYRSSLLKSINNIDNKEIILLEVQRLKLVREIRNIQRRQK